MVAIHVMCISTAVVQCLWRPCLRAGVTKGLMTVVAGGKEEPAAGKRGLHKNMSVSKDAEGAGQEDSFETVALPEPASDPYSVSWGERRASGG